MSNETLIPIGLRRNCPQQRKTGSENTIIVAEDEDGIFQQKRDAEADRPKSWGRVLEASNGSCRIGVSLSAKPRPSCLPFGFYRTPTHIPTTKNISLSVRRQSLRHPRHSSCGPLHLCQASAADSGVAVAEVHVQQPPRALELEVRRDRLGDVGARAVQLRRNKYTHTHTNISRRGQKKIHVGGGGSFERGVGNQTGQPKHGSRFSLLLALLLMMLALLLHYCAARSIP